MNKSLTDFLHILKTEANSGWLIEENSLTVTLDQFKKEATKNGIAVEYKKGFAKPEKIVPGQVPTAVVEFIAHAERALRSSTGIDETLSASGPANEMSGVAYQARSFAAQQKLAVPLDNLGRTRHVVAEHYIPRIMRITKHDEMGDEVTEELSVNEPEVDEEGNITRYLNDLTQGEYSVVISEQPMQVTFDNSQFLQCESLAKNFGYIVPPAVALRYSTLSDRGEVARAIEQASATKPNPVDEAKARLAAAQAGLAEANTQKIAVDTVNAAIESIYGATQAAAQIATIPQTASIADEILQSAGFVDMNTAPIIPQGQLALAPPPGAGLAGVAPEQPLLPPTDDPNGPAPENTNPLTPANPGTGMTAGIESQGAV